MAEDKKAVIWLPFEDKIFRGLLQSGVIELSSEYLRDLTLADAIAALDEKQNMVFYGVLSGLTFSYGQNVVRCGFSKIYHGITVSGREWITLTHSNPETWSTSGKVYLGEVHNILDEKYTTSFDRSDDSKVLVTLESAKKYLAHSYGVSEKQIEIKITS